MEQKTNNKIIQLCEKPMTIVVASNALLNIMMHDAADS